MRKYTETSTESKLKKTLYGNKNNIFTFCIGTPENPMAQRQTDEENERLRKEFETDLKRLRLHFYRIEGKYGNEENSYVVANVNLDYCKYLFGSKKYNQESFIFGVIDPVEKKASFYYYEQTDGVFTLRDSETKIKDETSAEDFFSKYRNFKFSIPFSIFTEALEEISESLDQDYGWDSHYRETLEYVSLVENKTLKHIWEYSCLHLLTENQEEERKIRTSQGEEYLLRWKESILNQYIPDSVKKTLFLEKN